MKNTVSKGFVYYLFLLASIVCGVACIFGAILLFSPGTSLFGIKYINHNLESQFLYEDIYDDQSAMLDTLITEGKITTINFVTDYVDFNIENEDVVSMRIIVAARISGFANAENKDKFTVEAEFNEEAKSYTFKCFGPQCNVILFSENAKITFALPLSAKTQNLQINYITETGNIVAGKKIKDDYTIRALHVESSNNSLVEIGNKLNITENLDLDVQKGEIVLNTNITDKLGNITPSIDVDRVKIKTNDAKIEIQSIKADEFKLISEASSIKIGSVDGAFEYDAYRGVIIVGTITGKFSCSERVEISNIQIDKCYGEVLLPKANTSNITIGEAFSNCSIVTDSGNVTINKCRGYAYVETNTGKIEITQVSDKVTQTEGLLRTLTVISHKSGDIKINFEDVVGLNEIKANDNGDITINFTKQANFILEYNCNEKAPTLSTGIDPNPAQKVNTYYRGDTNTTNRIKISNNKGNTKIEDTLIVQKNTAN